MQCSQCGHENRPDSRFCLGCGAPQGLACSSCGRELPGEAAFCDGCGARLEAPAAAAARERSPVDYTPRHLGEKILQSRSALEGERKQVTVLFADVKGSMELAEVLGGEEWHAILDRFFEILADGIHRFEGTVNQYTGDGIMALFGAPIAHEDHARRACYAALHLLDGLREYTQELRLQRGLDFAVRIGIHSGDVVVGKIGDDLRMDYTAQGHTVGLASRLEQLAEAGRAYLSSGTAEQVRGFFELEDLGTFQVKGATAAVRAYALTGVGQLRTRFDLSRSRGLSRFVGRDDDVAILDAALERARAGEGGIVGVVAHAGTGKSRLCFEFLERARAEGIAVVEGSAVAHGVNVPYLPILEVMRDFFQIAEHDDDRSVRDKVAGRLLLLDETYRDALPVLFEFLGIADAANPAPSVDGALKQRQLYGVLRSLLQGADAETPGIALIEDLHWIDGGTEAWLAEWAEAIEGTHNLLLVNFRPEYSSDWMQRSTYRQVPIQPLGADAIRELLQHLIGSQESTAGLAEMVHERTAGNPFFTEEVVRSLIESGDLEGSPGAYRLVTPLQELPVPASVQALLSARIDRLVERDKQTLQTAAVIGKEFGGQILERVAPASAPDLSESLSLLRAGEFIYEQALYPEALYSFKHPLTQQVAYESQLSQRRADVHAATARAIEERHTPKLDEHAGLLAHHWERAGHALEAARWHIRAAAWVTETSYVQALDHYRRALTHLDELPHSREATGLGARARIGILQFAWRLGLPREEVAELLERGLELALELSDRALEVKLRLPFAVYCACFLGDEHERLRHSGDALEAARAMNDQELILSSLCVHCSSLLEFSRSDEMVALLDPELAQAPDDPELGREYWGFDLYAFLIGLRAAMLARAGRIADAERDLAVVADRARGSERLESLYFLHMHSRDVKRDRGDRGAQQFHAERAVDIAERLGAPLHRYLALIALTDARLRSGDLDGARDTLSSARSLMDEMGLAPTSGIECLEVAVARPDDSTAFESLVEHAIARSAEHPYYRGTTLVALGRARLEAGVARDEVVHLLDSAEEAFASVDAELARTEVLEVRAELAQREGLDADTRQLRSAARRRYAELGADGHTARLDALD